MSRVPIYALAIVAASAAAVLPARAQAVISTRSGVVHFFEGTVYVAGQPLEARLGKFTSIPEGADLRTERGRAEVLLTPGVFLRVSENSAIRMIATDLSATRVELLAGSAFMDSAEPVVGTSVTLIYKSWNVHQPQKGVYRIDCEPPRLQVRAGEAEVSAGSGAPMRVEQGMDLPFAEVLAPESSTAGSPDALTDWAAGRAESISTDNAIAANIQDPASMTGLSLPIDGLTYFPMLGMYGSSLYGAYGSPSSYQPGLYGSLSPYQPGFYSIYLPGYTYRPVLLRLPSGGLQRPLYPSYPSSGIGLSRPPVTRAPIPHPVTVRPLPGAVRVGGHR